MDHPASITACPAGVRTIFEVALSAFGFNLSTD
jgi:hypothetical protein